MKQTLTQENQEIINYFEKLVDENNLLVIPDEVYSKMSIEYGILLNEHFTKTRLMQLPKNEIKFSEWLKENDPEVWNDLWCDDSGEFEGYVMSLALLPKLLQNDGRGLPICDLQKVDNHYFSVKHMPDKDAKIFVESIRERFMNRDDLTTAQLLALEISVDDIDIWHFAYKHKIDVNTAKEALAELVADNTIIHLKDAEYLAPFIEI